MYRKAILAALTGTGSPGTERIDHLVRLFRATHQFNQEEQELTREFQKDCHSRISGSVNLYPENRFRFSTRWRLEWGVLGANELVRFSST
jgi:hypothetical protein